MLGVCEQDDEASGCIKVKLSLCITEHDAIKTYLGRDIAPRIL
jgi:hypothetical protein